MRRLASVFAPSRRSDKPDASAEVTAPPPPPTPPRHTQKKSSVFSSLSRKHPPSTDPPPLIPSDLANSSSSSASSGSTTLRTPDDDGLPSKKANWKSWLGGKHSADDPRLPWHPSKPAPSNETETDDASSQSDVPYGLPDDIHLPSFSPQQLVTARANARTLIINSLLLQPTSHPLLHLPDALSFPRSCHSSRRLRRRETLESNLHKKALLARLDRLSPSAQLSIAPLASNLIPPKSQPDRNFQVDFFPPTDSVSIHSSGLANWVSRPCYEDRFQLWTRQDSGEITRTRIPGSQLGVAALELSETLELLAGTLLESEESDIPFDPTLEFTLPTLTFNLDPPVTQIKELDSQPLSLPLDLSQSRDSLAKPSQPSTLPQPLPTAPSPVPSPVPQHNVSRSSGSAAVNEPVPKRGVRFADDDGKDDQIPLGYVLRIRKNKEEKARFLREERERRAQAAQLSMENRRAAAPPQENRVSRVAAPRHAVAPLRPLISLTEAPRPHQPTTVSHIIREEERLRREAERIEMDKLRRSRELARKQAEERERAYVEELQATRARREAARAGRPLESVSFPSRVPDDDRSTSRDSMRASLRRSSLSRKHVVPDLTLSPISPRDGSPGSSLPPTPGSQYSFSRPSSLYSAHTASSEDVRGRDGRHVSRRMSMVSDPAKQTSLHPPYDPRVSFNPYSWANVPPVSAIPPVPPIPAIPMVNGMPFYGMDMPLLPPTPPFMMNQYGARPRLYTGSQGQHSPLQSSTSLPQNYSSEGVDHSSRNSSPHSSGSHQRRSSDDDARISKTVGYPRSGSQGDVRARRTSPSMRPVPSQSITHRSSWLPPEQNSTKRSSLRPASTGYSSGAPTPTRRQTAAS